MSRPHGPGASWPVTAGAGLAGAGGVSAAVGGAEVRRVPSLNAQPSRRIMCLMLCRMTYLRGNRHRTDLAGCPGKAERARAVEPVARGRHLVDRSTIGTA